MDSFSLGNISAQWTPEERLMVISVICNAWSSKAALPGRIMDTINIIASYGPDFLELNRQNIRNEIEIVR